MAVEVREERIEEALADHAALSIAFEVRSVLDVELHEAGFGGIRLVERPVAVPWIKDYDAVRGEGPTRWAKRFDLTQWGLLSAWDGGTRVGGAVIAFDTHNVHMLRGRTDLAVLWDLRVAPESRHAGVGSMLFSSVEEWAKTRGCTRLEVETQNVNVPACRFYVSRGCELALIDRFAYPELPDEVELLWYKELR